MEDTPPVATPNAPARETDVLIIGGGVYARSQLRASLPQVDGTTLLAGLSATVTVERDGLGVPTISGAAREDVARALGFVHAQERFFQMDLQRPLSRREDVQLTIRSGSLRELLSELAAHRLDVVERESRRTVGEAHREVAAHPVEDGHEVVADHADADRADAPATPCS